MQLQPCDAAEQVMHGACIPGSPSQSLTLSQWCLQVEFGTCIWTTGKACPAAHMHIETPAASLHLQLGCECSQEVQPKLIAPLCA